jgi:Protein of unknown function (DUF559)
VARHALIPPELAVGPFRAADAIASGVLTRNHLRGPAWRRLYQGIYADATLAVDHRLLCQAAGLLRVDAVVALDAMLRQSKLSPGALLAYIESHAWWPGVAAARTAFSSADGLAESPQETRMRLLILSSDLPVPTAQFKIFKGRRFVARVDFAYEEHKLALEYDGDYHRETMTFRFDMERQRELDGLGWRVLRFNADDVLRFPDRMLAEIRAALRRS